jgi:proto-oncogene tyrosine-protein kinase Met
MKKFEHCNVLKLRGICFDEDNSPLILLPFMSEGDLLSYIRNVENILTLEDLLLFAVDIAKGSDNVIKMVIFKNLIKNS